ncbi:MAG: putative collagen-binding domain-containing protein [Terriglobia bacterium]
MDQGGTKWPQTPFGCQAPNCPSTCGWFNPVDGSTELMGACANTGSRDFTPPASDDWVLVIDAVEANLPAPGSAEL